MMVTTTFVSIAVTVFCIVVSGIETREILKGSVFKQRNPDDQCPRTTEQKLLAHESDCTLFYICLNGRAVLQKCPNNLHFSIRTSVCDFPGNAGCEKGTTSLPKGKIGGDFFDIECPSPTGRDTAVLVSHPMECDKYFMCDNGVPHLRTCQPGLHFNPSLRACDYPDAAGCETVVTKSPREQVVGGRSGLECPAKNGVRPVLMKHETDCSKFYICDNGTPHPKDCQAGLHFNPKINACDYPANVNCDSVGLMLAPGEPSPFCPTVSGKIPIFYGHPSNCSIYYLCSNGLAYEFVCPARLHFNLRQKVCDYEAAARCPAGKKSNP